MGRSIRKLLHYPLSHQLRFMGPNGGHSVSAIYRGRWEIRSFLLSVTVTTLALEERVTFLSSKTACSFRLFQFANGVIYFRDVLEKRWFGLFK